MPSSPASLTTSFAIPGVEKVVVGVRVGDVKHRLGGRVKGNRRGMGGQPAGRVGMQGQNGYGESMRRAYGSSSSRKEALCHTLFEVFFVSEV